MDEGYVKFNIQVQDGPAPDEATIDELNRTRTALVDRGLVGMYDNGIGYGNVSVRDSEGFWISGTATGAKRVLSPEDYAHVVETDVRRNFVRSEGRIRASSESLTHAAVYEARPSIQAVLHAHSKQLFDFMLEHGYARTSPGTPYGTPEMAREIGGLVQRRGEARGVVVMAGHEEGVLAYGTSIRDAMDLLVSVHTRMSNQTKS